jgi:hypothetical protein
MRLRMIGALVASSVVAACGGDEKPAPGVEVKDGGARIEVRDESGALAVVAPDAGVPEDFPAQVPLPEGATIVSYMADELEKGRSFTLQLEVADVAKAAEDHREKLRKAGFRIVNQQETEGSAGGFESYQALTPQWDVTVIAAREPGSTKNLMVMNVSPPASESLEGDSPEE